MSRNNLPYLFTQVAMAAQAQDGIPQPFIKLLITQQTDWTSLTVQQLFSSGLAQSTCHSYQSGSNQYRQFCKAYKIVTLFLVNETHFMQFVASLFIIGLSAGTVKLYLAALRYTQISLRLGDPHICNIAQLEYVIKGSEKVALKPSHKRLPITPEILAALKQFWKAASNQFNAAAFWAASCMCFFSFLRMGEVVASTSTSYDPAIHLCFGDVKLDNHESPQFLEACIKASNTDPFFLGVSVYLEITSSTLCPVAAILSYMVMRGTKPGPFFILLDGKYLTRDRLVKAIRDGLSSAGINLADYAGHSFQIGAATIAARKGIQDSTVKMLGHWQSSASAQYNGWPLAIFRPK